jgi:hypothetical protein
MHETGIGMEVEIYATNLANKTKRMSTSAFGDDTLKFASHEESYMIEGFG